MKNRRAWMIVAIVVIVALLMARSFRVVTPGITGALSLPVENAIAHGSAHCARVMSFTEGHVEVRAARVYRRAREVNRCIST